MFVTSGTGHPWAIHRPEDIRKAARRDPSPRRPQDRSRTVDPRKDKATRTHRALASTLDRTRHPSASLNLPPAVKGSNASKVIVCLPPAAALSTFPATIHAFARVFIKRG